MLYILVLTSVVQFIHLQSGGVLLSCEASLGAAFVNVGELYLGIKQFSQAKINSGKSCKPGFIVFLQMFNRAFGYLPLCSVLLYRLSTILAQVRIHDSVYNSVSAIVDFYCSDREAETLHCSYIR